MYLLRKIIQQMERRDSEWREGASGSRSLKNAGGQFYKDGHTMDETAREALELEAAGLIRIKWVPGYRGRDIESLTYRLEDSEKLYALYKEKEDPDFCPRRVRVREYQDFLSGELAGTGTLWIRRYYEALLHHSETEDAGEKLRRAMKYRDCFRGLDELREPMFKRIFSMKYLRNSKTFEKELQNHVISSARKYCDEIEEEMDDTEVLCELYIQDYAQELMVKGPLNLLLRSDRGQSNSTGKQNGRSDSGGEDAGRICLGGWKYGATLNTEMLNMAQAAAEQPGIRRVITIENKANFISAPFRCDTLYVFSHGYFSPKERAFLQKLEEVLRRMPEKVKYYHSGDLDYGGIRIFQYIRAKIFPDLQPLMMDAETFRRYEKYAEPMEEQKLEKLKRICDPLFDGLIREMVRTGTGIEQEAFLIKD